MKEILFTDCKRAFLHAIATTDGELILSKLLELKEEEEELSVSFDELASMDGLTPKFYDSILRLVESGIVEEVGKTKYRSDEGDGMFRLTLFGRMVIKNLLVALELRDCLPEVNKLEKMITCYEEREEYNALYEKYDIDEGSIPFQMAGKLAFYVRQHYPSFQWCFSARAQKEFAQFLLKQLNDAGLCGQEKGKVEVK
jgi:hypothetical protein